MQSSRSLRSKRHHSETEEDDCSDMPIAKRITRLNIKSQRNSVDDPSSSHQSEMGAYSGAEAQQSPAWVSGMEHWVNGMGQVSPTSPPAGSVYPAFPQNREATSMYHGAWSAAAAQNSIPHPRHPFVSPPTPPMDNPAFSHHHVPQNIPLHPAHHQQFPENQHMFQATPDFSQYDDEGMRMDFDYQPELGEGENPHYYHINHLLFNAHCDRRRRGGQPLGS